MLVPYAPDSRFTLPKADFMTARKQLSTLPNRKDVDLDKGVCGGRTVFLIDVDIGSD